MFIPYDWVKSNVIDSIYELNDVSNLFVNTDEYEKKDVGEVIIIEANFQFQKPSLKITEQTYSFSYKKIL